jgi:hypothetical protein
MEKIIRKRELFPAIPYAGTSQFRFNGYHLRPKATPASVTKMKIVEATTKVKPGADIVSHRI